MRSDIPQGPQLIDPQPKTDLQGPPQSESNESYIPAFPVEPPQIAHGDGSTTSTVPPAPRLPFNNRYNILLLIPLVVLAVGYALQSTASTGQEGYRVIVITFAVISVAALVLLCVKQDGYLQRTQQRTNSNAHLIILLTALMLPFAAAVLGDVHGAAHFDDNPDGIVSNLMGLGVGAVIATVYLFAITVKNAVSIHTGRQLSWLKIVGQIFSVLGYVVVAGVSLLIYNIIYSLHDPSTE